MNIAIFGGTFNPVHNEHIKIAQTAIKKLNLDKLIVVPSNITPQKGGRMVAKNKDRFNMCRLAFSTLDKVEVDSFEQDAGGVSYSYITCQEFAKRYPSANRYFLLGGDMLENFPSWKNPEKILELFTIAVCARVDSDKLQLAVDTFHKKFNRDCVVLDYVGADVSSTKIRALSAVGEDVSEYTPKCVAEYLKDNLIYSFPYAQKVKSLLTEERWGHTVRVAECAGRHSTKFGVDERSAICASLLHDSAKYLSLDSDLLAGFSLTEDVPPPVIHQFTGAYIASNVFGVEDEDILNAIRYHTSGRENMSNLEKLIFLSDMLESGRNFEGVEFLRASFEKGLDEGMTSALAHQVEYLLASNKKIYPLTMRAYEYYKNLRK
jgi:nicotinate-nucleotide adenylyltransferase